MEVLRYEARREVRGGAGHGAGLENGPQVGPRCFGGPVWWRAPTCCPDRIALLVAGKLESGPEVLLFLKTTTTRLAALEKLIVAEHPYDTPEFVVLPISRGNQRYLAWLQGSVG